MKRNHKRLQGLFVKCRRTITAIGDENRQAIILTLLDGPMEGMRVGDIKQNSHLSQPAVSHHLRILREAGLVTMQKIGTMNYYRLNPNKTKMQDMLDMCQEIMDEMKKCEENQNEESI